METVFSFLLGLAISAGFLGGLFYFRKKHSSQKLFFVPRKTDPEKAKYEAILISIGEGVIVTDKEKNITFVNKTVESLLGINHHNILGKPFSAFFTLHDENNQEQKKDALADVLQTGRKKQDTYYWLGEHIRPFPGATTISPIILNLNWEIGGLVITFRDITREKEIDRMKTEFVSLASHQLRTPLSVIHWHTEMLFSKKVGDLNQRQKDYVNEIFYATKRMTALVNSLLNVSRIETGTFAINAGNVKLQELVQKILQDINPKIEEKKLHIVKHIQENMPVMVADENLLRIVIENLLTNAVKYTPEEGIINVSVSMEEKIVIIVSDTGYGIPKDEQSKIFTKLFRAGNVLKRVTDGNGLGLYIVKSIIEVSGGAISFTSEENKGTTFTVSWPKEGMKKKEGVKALT